MSVVTTLVHNRVHLALHHLRDRDRDGDGGGDRDRDGGRDAHTLLLLHGLGERAPRSVPALAATWPGPIAALDFTGHGDSTVPRGGGYTSEILLGDADAALAHLGTVTVLGRGLGAYIALQLAGARPALVRGAVLTDGPGLAGGATEPTSQSIATLPSDGSAPDPYALAELARDLRPPDYATAFVRLAVQGSDLDEPIAVAAVFRPPWLAAVAAEQGVVVTTVVDALAGYAASPAVPGAASQ